MNPQPQFVPMQVFPMMPQQQMQYQRRDEPPMRVQVALEFLGMLTAKTMTRAAACENQVIEIDGQKLCDDESKARATACSLLRDYFIGNLEPDQYEQYERSQSDVMPGNGRAGTIMNCPVCSPNPPRSHCTLCRGEGELLVFPTVRK